MDDLSREIAAGAKWWADFLRGTPQPPLAAHGEPLAADQVAAFEAYLVEAITRHIAETAGSLWTVKTDVGPDSTLLEASDRAEIPDIALRLPRKTSMEIRRGEVAAGSRYGTLMAVYSDIVTE